MNRRFAFVLIHVFGCLAFLAFPYLLSDSGFSKLVDLPYDPREQRNVLSYVLCILFFYLNYFVFIPRLFFPKQYLSFALSALVLFVAIQCTLVLVSRYGVGPHVSPTDVFPDGQPRHFPPVAQPGELPPSFRMGMPPPHPFPNRQPGGPSELTQTFFLTLAGFLLAIVLRVNNRWRETEQQRLQTELSYLKAQINPHFLFNTLNSLYALALIESPATADALVKLSSFLRYVIQESQKEYVSLQNELDYIEHYIALQRLRLGDTATILFSCTGQPLGKQIAPLLLISFIENACKYGVSPEEPSTINISIQLLGTDLHCHIQNQKVRVFQPTAVASGIGLANTRSRLQHLYPKRHQLSIQDLPDCFIVDLQLTL